MYQVTAIFQDSEIGYGEGEKIVYSIEECIDSIPEIFKNRETWKEVKLLVLGDDGSRYVLPA